MKTRTAFLITVMAISPMLAQTQAAPPPPVVDTGLTWSQNDSGRGMKWEDALGWAQQKNAEKFCGHDDWRLPSVKELQSLVDYVRARLARLHQLRP